MKIDRTPMDDTHDDDLAFFQSALLPGESSRVDVAAVQHRVRRIVRRRIASLAIVATAGILIATTALLSVGRWGGAPTDTRAGSEAVDFDSLRSAVAELERDMSLLEQEIAGPAQSGATRVESILIETAEESFEEETAAILLTAALHRLDAGIALASSHSRFEEIVSYFPDTAAASAAREQISMIVEGTH